LHNGNKRQCGLQIPGYRFRVTKKRCVRSKIKASSIRLTTKKTLKGKISHGDKGVKDNRVNMTISTSQVSAVIKTYLKNAKDRLENVTNLSGNPEDVRDEVTVSDDAKKILFERIGKRVVEKLKNEMAQNY
jgi:hypothetical protein